MGKVCLDCLEIYTEDAIRSTFKQSEQGLYQDCPKSICDGRVHNLDDRLMPSIVLLNEKGYETVSSSGGEGMHNMTEMYIEFAEFISSFEDIPFGFTMKKRKVEDGFRIVLSFEPSSDDPYDHFSESLAAAESLYLWVLDLESVFDFSVFVLNPNGSSFKEIFGEGFLIDEAEEEKKDLKDIVPDGKIKMGSFTNKDKASDEKTPEEKPKKKRGRPKKED